MQQNRIGSTRLYCFSPPVMMATFLLEIGLMVWVMVRYRHTAIVKLVSALLGFLAVFQLAEYNVCEGAFGVDSLTWARIGFVAITALPPLGLHIILTIARKRSVITMSVVYLIMAVFMAYFIFAPQGLGASLCGGNYVIFAMHPEVSWWYGLYYYGFEMIALLTAGYFALRTSTRSVRRALYGMMSAYLVLLIPTTTVNLVNPATIQAIPSIMCGFAVFTALITALYVVPKMQQPKTSR